MRFKCLLASWEKITSLGKGTKSKNYYKAVKYKRKKYVSKS